MRAPGCEGFAKKRTPDTMRVPDSCKPGAGDAEPLGP